jgi:hypothetical protein
MVVMGVGFGMAFVPITIAATSGVAAEDSGLASGLLNTTQQVGGSLGLAVLSADGGETDQAGQERGLSAEQIADPSAEREQAAERSA